jgi:PAS domain S-box-containing protein
MKPKAKILVVDDDLDFIEISKLSLEGQGYQILSAFNAKEGWKMVEKQKPDLIIMDLMMERLDSGMALSQQIKGHPQYTAIPILMLTSIARDTGMDFTPRTRVTRGLERRSLLLEAKKLREERERNLLELANEKSRTQTIIHCMGDGLLVTNRDEQVVFCNPAGRRLLGVKRPIQVGEPIAHMTNDPELLSLVEAAMNLKEGQEMASKELVARMPNDPALMANCAPVKDEKNQTIGVVTVLRDITELKELDKAKSTFVSMVAHELRAPLAAIEGYLDVILEGVGGDDPQKMHRILERSRERTRGLLALINDLLAISRMQAGRLAKEKEKLPLGILLKEIAELMKGEALGKKVTIEMAVPDDLPLVQANREDVTRVFTNLLDNAIKYNHHGGRVFLRAGAGDAFVRVEVHDTGIGIPKKDVAHLFDEFYRVKSKETRAITGTGLGLSIAKKIVEGHNGHIEVESRLHQGSTFRVLLPL